MRDQGSVRSCRPGATATTPKRSGGRGPVALSVSRALTAHPRPSTARAHAQLLGLVVQDLAESDLIGLSTLDAVYLKPARPSRRPGRAAGSTWHRALRDPSSARAQVWRSGRQRSFRSSHSCTHKPAGRPVGVGAVQILPRTRPVIRLPVRYHPAIAGGGRSLGRAAVRAPSVEKCELPTQLGI